MSKLQKSFKQVLHRLAKFVSAPSQQAEPFEESELALQLALQQALQLAVQEAQAAGASLLSSSRAPIEGASGPGGRSLSIPGDHQGG